MYQSRGCEDIVKDRIDDGKGEEDERKGEWRRRWKRERQQQKVGVTVRGTTWMLLDRKSVILLVVWSGSIDVGCSGLMVVVVLIVAGGWWYVV